MMVKRLMKRLIMGTLFMCLLVLACYADEGKKHIKIAILPCTNVVMTFKKFHSLVTYLKQETGFDIRIVVPMDSAGFERAIRNGDIDFAFQDPHTYVRYADLYDRGALVRALTLEGTTSQSGVVIARKDSLISKLEDLKGKTVMMGCPKFDDAQAYIDKFAEIFKTADIKRITTLVMEVPCCAGLPVIVKKGLEMSGKKIPLEEVVVSTRGKLLNKD